MSKSIDQAAFVFDYLRSCSGRTLSSSTSWDDDLDFIVDFDEKFPGRKPDPNHLLAAARVRRLLKRLYDDGWLDRGRLSNPDRYHPHDEPTWQYVYRLPDGLHRRLKSGVETPLSAAERWGG